MTAATDVSPYWEIVPAVVGGILGAFAGGLPAWLIAKRQSDESLRRESERTIEHEKALAFQVCSKLMTITNGTIILYNHIRRCRDLNRRAENEGMQPWQTLIPMVGFTDEGNIRFEADEMAVFAKASERQFMMDAMLLAQRHSSTLASFKIYCDRREDFLETAAPNPVQFNGEVGSTIVSHQEMMLMMPKMIPLNNLVNGLNDGMEHDLRLARSVSVDFGKITKRYFADPKFIGLAFPSDDELAQLRAAASTN